MALSKAAKPKKRGRFTLRDDDMLTTRVYGRRSFLRGVGIAMAGAGTLIASSTAAHADNNDDDPAAGDQQDNMRGSGDEHHLQDRKSNDND